MNKKRLVALGRGGIVAAACVGLGAVALVATPAIAGTAESPTLLVDSATLTGPIVAQGVLNDASGKPSAAGTVVFLESAPTLAQLSDLGTGDTATSESLGYAYTGADGGFVLRYSHPDALAQYADLEGNLNLEVLSADGYSVEDIVRTLPPQVTSTASAKRLTADARANIQSQANTTYPRLSVHALKGSPAVAHPRAASGTKIVGQDPDSPTPTATPEPTDDSPVVDTTADPSNTPVPQPGSGDDPNGNTPDKGITCRTGVYKQLGNRYVIVGEGFTSGVATARYSYTANSTSSVGVGVSLSGAKGSFSASGTTAVTNSSTVTFAPLTSGGARWRTEFYYDIFVHTCSGQHATYSTSPASWSGGATSVSSSTPSATRCVVQAKNTGFTDDRSRATTFSEGVGVSADIGINLSSQTGFTKSANISFTFSKGAGHLCGTHDYPSGDPQRLVAKP